MKFIVKLTGCRADGRSVDGEYDGQSTPSGARFEGAWFAAHSAGGSIAIYSVHGAELRYVETVRS